MTPHQQEAERRYPTRGVTVNEMVENSHRQRAFMAGAKMAKQNPNPKYRIEYKNGMVQEKYLLPEDHTETFLVGSPMFKAIETGVLRLPKQQGGDHKVKITLLPPPKI